MVTRLKQFPGQCQAAIIEASVAFRGILDDESMNLYLHFQRLASETQLTLMEMPTNSSVGWTLRLIQRDVFLLLGASPVLWSSQ